MTRTMLWKTSWLGRGPAETRPCLSPATEPPLQEALRSPPVGKKGHTSRFSFGGERSGVKTVLAGLSEPRPCAGEKTRFGCVNVPRTVLAPSILNVFIF